LRILLRNSRPAPPLPPRFQEAVWQRLERGRALAEVPSPALAWLERLIERLLLPRFALASLALLLLAGGLTGVLTSGAVAKQLARERYLTAVAPNSVR
jgi:hypothetical protein